MSEETPDLLAELRTLNPSQVTSPKKQSDYVNVVLIALLQKLAQTLDDIPPEKLSTAINSLRQSITALEGAKGGEEDKEKAKKKAKTISDIKKRLSNKN